MRTRGRTSIGTARRLLVGALALGVTGAVLTAVPAEATTRIAAAVPMFDVALTADGQYAYAVGFAVNNEGRLYRISLADNSISELLSNLDRPRDIAISGDGTRLFIGGYDKVYAVDPSSPSTDDSWLTPGWGDIGGIAITGQAVYAASFPYGKIARLIKGGGAWPAATNFTEIYNPGASIWSGGLAVSADDSVLLLAAEGSEIRRINSPLTCSAPCAGSLVAGTHESGISDIAIDSSATFAYYARNNQNSFRRLDLVTGTVSTITGDSGSGSWDVALSNDDAYAYLLYKGEHSRNPRIQKVRTSDNTVIATVDTPVLPCNSAPQAIATSPVNDTLMVAGAGHNDASCATLGGAVYRFPTTAEAPTSLSATSGDGSATVSFTAGADGLSAVTNYEYTLDDATWTALSPADASSPVTITGLPNGTPQSIKIRPVNAAGSGASSSAVAVTPAAPPGPPTVTSIDWDDTTASIYFSPPISDGGAAITTYEYSLDAGVNWNARGDGGTTNSPLVVTGLTTNTTYSIEMRALNSAGGGTTPPAPIVVTPGAPHTPPAPPPVYRPGLPGAVLATPGEGSALISWEPPADQGSFPVSTYQVSSNPGGSSCLTTSTQCLIKGLIPGTPYTFTVRALNGAGWGVASAPSNVVTPTGPVSPTITITGSRSGRTVKVAGMSTGLRPDTSLTPRIRKGTSSGFTTGRAKVLVQDDGSFTWKRRAKGAVEVYFTFDDMRSNQVAIPAR